MSFGSSNKMGFLLEIFLITGKRGLQSYFPACFCFVLRSKYVAKNMQFIVKMTDFVDKTGFSGSALRLLITKSRSLRKDLN